MKGVWGELLRRRREKYRKTDVYVYPVRDAPTFGQFLVRASPATPFLSPAEREQHLGLANLYMSVVFNDGVQHYYLWKIPSRDSMRDDQGKAERLAARARHLAAQVYCFAHQSLQTTGGDERTKAVEHLRQAERCLSRPRRTAREGHC